MTPFYVGATKIGDTIRTSVLAKDDGQLSSTLSVLARISLAVDTPISDFLPTAKEWCAANVCGIGGLLSYAERNGRLPWADAE